MSKNKRIKIKETIKEHIMNNLREYIIILLIFIIGIFLGVFFIHNIQDEQRAEISEYINTFINDLKNGAKLDYFKLLKTSFGNNLITVIILWFMSSTVIGIPIVYGEIGYKGFCLGYTISSVVATLGTGKGILFVLTSMLLHNIIFIPCLLY